MEDAIRDCVFKSYHTFIDALQQWNLHDADESRHGFPADSLSSSIWVDCSRSLRDTLCELMHAIDVLAERMQESGDSSGDTMQTEELMDTLATNFEIVDAFQQLWNLLEVVFMCPSSQVASGLIAWLANMTKATFALRLQQCSQLTQPELAVRRDAIGLDYWADLYSMAMFGHLEMVSDMICMHSEVSLALASAQHMQASSSRIDVSAVQGLVSLLKSHPCLRSTVDDSFSAELALWKRRLLENLASFERLSMRVPSLSPLLRILAGDNSALLQGAGGDWRAFLCAKLLYGSQSSGTLSRGMVAVLLEEAVSHCGSSSNSSSSSGNSSSGGGQSDPPGDLLLLLLPCLRDALTGSTVDSVARLLQLAHCRDTRLVAVTSQALVHLCVALLYGGDRKEMGALVETILVPSAEALQALSMDAEMLVAYLSLAPHVGQQAMPQLLSRQPVRSDQDALSLAALMEVWELTDDRQRLLCARATHWLQRSSLCAVLGLEGAEERTPCPSAESKALFWFQLAARADAVAALMDALMFHLMRSARRCLPGLAMWPAPPLAPVQALLVDATREDGARVLRPSATDSRDEVWAALQCAMLSCDHFLQAVDLARYPAPALEQACLAQLQRNLQDYAAVLACLLADPPQPYGQAAALLVELLGRDPLPRVSVRYRLHLLELAVWLHKQAAADGRQMPSGHGRGPGGRGCLFSKEQVVGLLGALSEVELVEDSRRLMDLSCATAELVHSLKLALIGMMATASVAENRAVRDTASWEAAAVAPPRSTAEGRLCGLPEERDLHSGFAGFYLF